jgi:tetratricopeptide (TPR) repeat protein
VLGALLAWKSDDFRSQAFAAVLFILGLLAKETAVVFPVLLLVVLFYKKRYLWSRTHLQTWPLWLITAAYLIARGTVLDLDQTYQFYQEKNVYTDSILVRFYTFLATLPDYFQLLFAPSNLHMERQTSVYIAFDHPKVMMGAAILALPLLFLIAALKRPQGTVLWAFLFAFLWFFAAYFPCSGIVIPVNSFFLEHWMYLPTIGLFLGGGAVLGALLENRKILRVIATAAVGTIAACFLLLTLQQNLTWRDPVTFYSYILRFEKGTARVHNNLAMAYEDRGESQKALTHYARAIETEDVYAQTHHNIARLLLRNQRPDQAVQHLRRALQINPRFAPAENLLKALENKR